MTRRWYHEVSAEWLKARQTVLTATDIAGLQAEYKRYLKAGSPDKLMPGFAALWCQKHSDVYLDTGSVEAAARGHAMEPWVIDSWNQQAIPTFYHWDDCILCADKLGFSPDAMTVPQFTTASKMEVTTDGKFLVDATGIKQDAPNEIMEIKCYEPAQHMKAIIEDRMEHKELMQIAMSFAVLSNLETARLTWFCPGAPVSMFTEKYTRDDLHDRIQLILEIADLFMKQADKCTEFMMNSNSLEAKCTEEEVYMDYIAEQSKDNVFMLK